MGEGLGKRELKAGAVVATHLRACTAGTLTVR